MIKNKLAVVYFPFTFHKYEIAKIVFFLVMDGARPMLVARTAHPGSHYR